MVLSYRHAFHAGNPGDVLKHAVLSVLLRRILSPKEGLRKTLLYTDTHAGGGVYDFGCGFAQQNREFEAGIGCLVRNVSSNRCTSPPTALAEYLRCIVAVNELRVLNRRTATNLNNTLSQLSITDLCHRLLRTHVAHRTVEYPFRLYPSSSWIARYLAFTSESDSQSIAPDRFHLFDMHPSEVTSLQTVFSSGHATVARKHTLRSAADWLPKSSAEWAAGVTVHHMDGFVPLQTPPLQDPYLSSFVLVDPPFEAKSDYSRVESALAMAITQRHALNSTWMCWYPLLDSNSSAISTLRNRCAKIHTPDTRVSLGELHVDNASLGSHTIRRGMYGSGVVVVTSPCETVERTMRSLLPWLGEILSNGPMKPNVKWSFTTFPANES